MDMGGLTGSMPRVCLATISILVDLMQCWLAPLSPRINRHDNDNTV
jgi:hypothetical protein